MKKLLIVIYLVSFGLSIYGNDIQTRDNDSLRVNNLYKYLEKAAKPADEYILGKLKDYSIVSIGEDHWNHQHPKFFCEIIEKASLNDETRPDIIAIEFGNEIDQRTVNYVINSDTFVPDSVYRILQHSPDIYGNPYKEYFDIYKTVWQINQTLPKEKRIQIRLLDPAGIQDHFSKIVSNRNKDRDQSMFEKLRWDIINGKKVLFYGGQAHTQKQIRGTKINQKERYYNFPSAGYLIASAYPDDVFVIDLWSPLNMGKGYEINPETDKWVEKSYGIFDDAFDINGNIPCGFDLSNSPWGEINMMEYFGLPGKEDSWEINHENSNPYRKDILLSEIIDGIVYVKPTEEFTGATLIDIFTPDFIEECTKRSNGKLNSTEEILNYIKEQHPQLNY